MSILQHNGAAIICMAGKNCVAIAADTRFGLQQQTVTYMRPQANAPRSDGVSTANHSTCRTMFGCDSAASVCSSFTAAMCSSLKELCEGRLSREVFAHDAIHRRWL